MPTISSETLESFARDIFVAAGISSEEAAVVAGSLVAANLRGHDSHGVMRIPSYYDKIRGREVVPGAAFSVQKESDSLLVADGNWGFGQIQARRLTERLIDKAKTTGLAVGTLIHTTHIGRLGEYCELAAAAGLVSIVMVSTHGNSRHVAPIGGRVARLGTNPMAFGVPDGESLLLLDFATSATSEGNVRIEKIAGRRCPDGWLLDSDGVPTNDPNALYANPRGTILPMGGSQAYKGFGIALMIEIFAGALSGGVCMREVPVNQKGNCTFLQLYDPEHLGGREHFASEVRQLCEFIRSCPLAEGAESITLPGDRERRALAERSVCGIPFDEENWLELVKLAGELGVAAPAEAACCS